MSIVEGGEERSRTFPPSNRLAYNLIPLEVLTHHVAVWKIGFSFKSPIPIHSPWDSLAFLMEYKGRDRKIEGKAKAESK